MAKKDSKTCPECRSELQHDWEVCPFCGSVQFGYEREFAENQNPPKKPDNAASPESVNFEPASEDTGFQPPESLPAVPLTPDIKPDEETTCAIILLPGNKFDISNIGRALADIVQRPLADLTVPIRKGFLARNVSSHIVPRIAQLLKASDIHAVAVPEKDVLPLPPQYRTASVVQRDSLLLCGATAPDDHTYRLEFSPDQIRFAAALRSMYAASVPMKKPEKQKSVNPLFRKRYLKFNRAQQTANHDVFGHGYIIYLFLKKPERLVVIREFGFDLQTILRKIQSPENLQKQAHLLQSVLPEAKRTAGLDMLADLDENTPEWNPLTFASVKGADAYANWLYNLHFIDV